MRLINFPWGPYPRRLTHYLAEKGIGGIDLTEVEFPHVAANWPEAFLRDLSPGGTLPVLQTDEGVTIGQSIAMLEYLEEKYPTPNLLGSSAEARAATRELIGVLEEATTYLGIRVRQGSRVNAQRHKPDAGPAAVGTEKHGSKLRLVERMITGDTFLSGGSVTIALKTCMP